jgi:hypothetical protein
VCRLKSKGWAKSTSGTYLEFCGKYDLEPVPCTTKTVERYIAFLVDVKKFAFSSIRSYVNIISVLHKIHDPPDPIASCWNIRHLLTGVKRELGTSQDCKAAITPELLLKFISILDLDCHNDIAFWAACLTGFYGFVRPNNFLVKGSVDSDFNLRRVDVMPCSWGMLVTVKLPRLCNFVLSLLRSYFLCCMATLCVHTMLCPACWPYQGPPWIHYCVCLIIDFVLYSFSQMFSISLATFWL